MYVFVSKPYELSPSEKIIKNAAETCALVTCVACSPIAAPVALGTYLGFKTKELYRNWRIKKHLKRIMPEYSFTDKDILFGTRYENVTTIYIDIEKQAVPIITSQISKRCYSESQSFVFIITDPFTLSLHKPFEVPPRSIVTNYGSNISVLSNSNIKLHDYYGVLGKRFNVIWKDFE